MKMLRFVLLLSALGLVVAGCGGDPCEDLAKTCAKCTDATVKSTCNAIADADVHDACELTVDAKTYENQCK